MSKPETACTNFIIETCGEVRRSRVVNRAYVRAWALDYAKTNRSHPFKRVSEEFLNAVEAATKAFIRQRIDRAPSKGITLK